MDLPPLFHCTGGASLTSFFECELFPSSISSHETIFDAGGTITFIAAPAGYTGTWTHPPSQNRLQFDYADGTGVVATFDGRGVDAKCFEGKTVFRGSPYVSLYEVCFP